MQRDLLDGQVICDVPKSVETDTALNRDAADGTEALAVFRRKTHDHRKVPVAAFLVQISCGLAADRGCDGRIDSGSGGRASIGCSG